MLIFYRDVLLRFDSPVQHLGKTLRQCAVLATDRQQRDRWMRGRFLAQTARYTPVVAVDDHRGKRYFLDPRDGQVGRSLFTVGSFDLDAIERVVAELADLEITQVIDIGANIGTTIIELLGRYPDASGIAFEPDAKNFRLLSHNLLANMLCNRVVAHEMALSDVDGDVVLELAHDNFGDHRVRLGSPTPGAFDEHARITRSVPARRLDTLIENDELHVDAGTLVYIDAQGHEGHILAGASAIVAAGCPLVIEFWPYGLRRAGGYEGLIENMAQYRRVANLDEPHAETRMSDIETLTTRLGATGHLDLLLIP